MADGPAPGWYKSADGSDSYWDGNAWHKPVAPHLSVDAEPVKANGSDSDQEPMQVVESGALTSPAPVKKRGRGLWIAVVSAVVLLCIAGAATYWFFGREDAQVWALDNCQSEVTDMLKSPKTAEYSDVTVHPLAERYYLFPATLLTGLLEADEVDIEEAVDAMDLKRDKYNGEAASWLASQPGRDVRVVTGTVGSQNGFGATVESHFVCLYDRPEGEEPSIRVVSFNNKFIDSDWALEFMKSIPDAEDASS